MNGVRELKIGLSGFDCRFVCYITLPSVPSVAGVFDDKSRTAGIIPVLYFKGILLFMPKA